jgi:hypothetical protein
MALPSRRVAIRVGGGALLGDMTFPQLIAATDKAKPKARAKSIIFLHQWGGPGQHETFDMKPDAPDKVRGWYKPMSTVIPGLQICEKLPNIAKMVDRLSIIRCMSPRRRMTNAYAIRTTCSRRLAASSASSPPPSPARRRLFLTRM